MPNAPTRVATTERLHACAMCERTILLGEQPLRFAQHGRAHTVCLLCASSARRAGWVEEGRPAPPPVGAERGAGLRDRLRRLQRPAADATDPALLPHALGTADELARATTMVVGVDVFNASPYRRTISGISKSLGLPRVSVVAFGGRRPGAAITIAWDLSWYRYLVEPGGAPEVRLDERGDAVAELEERWQEWNAATRPDGSIALAIEAPAPGRPD